MPRTVLSRIRAMRPKENLRPKLLLSSGSPDCMPCIHFVHAMSHYFNECNSVAMYSADVRRLFVVYSKKNCSKNIQTCSSDTPKNVQVVTRDMYYGGSHANNLLMSTSLTGEEEARGRHYFLPQLPERRL